MGELFTGGRFLAEMEQRLHGARTRLTVVSPYVSEIAVRRILDQAPREIEICLITCLNPANLRSGSTSLSAIRELLAAPCSSVWHRESLHAKLFLIDCQFAYVGSANATGRGLWIGGQGNIEITVAVPMVQECVSFVDWLLLGSVPIDETFLAKLESLLEDPEPDGSSTATPSYQLRRVFYSHLPDRSLAAWPEGLDSGESPGFRRLLLSEAKWWGLDPVKDLGRIWSLWPAVEHLVYLLEEDSPRTFGDLTDRFHDLISDIPWPERKSLKTRLSLFLDWTVALCPHLVSALPAEHTTWYHLGIGEDTTIRSPIADSYE